VRVTRGQQAALALSDQICRQTVDCVPHGVDQYGRIVAASRFRSLFVIARNSSFAYKRRTPDLREGGRELGARYVVEGSVRRLRV